MSRRRRRQWAVPLLFLAPSLAVMALFSFYPMLHAIGMSFHRWRILGDAQFLGFDNYTMLLQSNQFWVALRNTLLFGLITVPVGVVLALGSALLLNMPLRARGFFRGVIFFPVTVSMVVIALIWSWMFSENYGIVNSALEAVGIEPQNWLAEPTRALAVIMVMSIWKGFGYGMVIYLAGLQTIPETVYEAARLDGASRRQMLWHITIPLLNPTTLFVTVISFIGSFQVFDQVYVMTEGGPGYSTSVLVHLIYELAYVRFRMGVACAAAIILLLITVAFTLIQIRFIRPQTGEGS
ncbi:sugar ABC transporter permease [Candidatus Sumerlaeota bacterium]|nr:sugar ABC transporter permease [Candidatus Sumerlaeota bacterium]